MTWRRDTRSEVAEPHDEWLPTDNQWAEPEGHPEGHKPAPVVYRIRQVYLPDGMPKNSQGGPRYQLRDNPAVPEYFLGEVVERETVPTYDFHIKSWHQAFDERDQLFPDLIVALEQAVCAYFYAPDEEYTPLDVVPAFDAADDEVRARIRRINEGENAREAVRGMQQQYDFSALPFDQQRALISQIEELKRRFRFEIIGPAE